MAPYSSILAWRILWTEEPGGLQSMGLQRVGQCLIILYGRGPQLPVRSWVVQQEVSSG